MDSPAAGNKRVFGVVDPTSFGSLNNSRKRKIKAIEHLDLIVDARKILCFSNKAIRAEKKRLIVIIRSETVPSAVHTSGHKITI